MLLAASKSFGSQGTEVSEVVRDHRATLRMGDHDDVAIAAAYQIGAFPDGYDIVTPRPQFGGDLR
jgi:hypothetical protein